MPVVPSQSFDNNTQVFNLDRVAAEPVWRANIDWQSLVVLADESDEDYDCDAGEMEMESVTGDDTDGEDDIDECGDMSMATPTTALRTAAPDQSCRTLTLEKDRREMRLKLQRE